MRKFLFVLPSDDMGGAEGVQQSLAKHLIKEGHDVRVLILTRARTNAWSSFGERISYLNTGSVYVGLLLLLTYRFGGTFDLVFSSQVYVNGALGLLRKLGVLKTKYLILRESTSVFLRYPKGLKRMSFTTFYKLGYRNSDLVIHQSKRMLTQLKDSLPELSNLNHQVIPNPIDLVEVRELADHPADLPNFQFILGVGRLIHAKGYDIAIKAFATLTKTHPDLHYVILGDGNLKEELMELGESLGIAERLHFLGHVANPFPYMKAARLCVMSSRIEGYPNVLLQMLALNPHVMSTNCAGGVDELPLHGVAPTDDVDGLLNQMNQALLGPPLNAEEVERELQSRGPGKFMEQIMEYLTVSPEGK
ncbi:glycosyltransferase [Phaeocystidibacter luteus]|uniref:Glycosyltransferase n=1 Tax=Phaeocystidibacter luteus TaxID=911197 RepID=A0A6N6RJ07_9FLAO|nr:glycosyltransferase [Phaeocystidibacter luteus]KAB2814333.1 glycosyltransferase [Phaeocystidibacter luteus]